VLRFAATDPAMAALIEPGRRDAIWSSGCGDAARSALGTPTGALLRAIVGQQHLDQAHGRLPARL